MAQIGAVSLIPRFGSTAVRAGGGQRLLKAVGEALRDGITLLAAQSPRGAQESYRGEVHLLVRSRHVSFSFQATERQRLAIYADALGQCRARGFVNGAFVKFLVATGASVIAMSRLLSRSIGSSLDGESRIPGSDRPVNGRVPLRHAGRGRGGRHRRPGERTAALDAVYPLEILPLLGMLFLCSVGLQIQGGVLTLRRSSPGVTNGVAG